MVAPLPSEASSTAGKILRVERCELIPYDGRGSPPGDEPETRLVASIERLLSSGTFYFSSVGDAIGRRGLFMRCQEREATSTKWVTDPLLQWNTQPLANLCGSSWSDGADHWVSPLIQGFALTSCFSDGGLRHTISVISRRSIRQAGTRYNARGIDDDGNVAIFTETECIVTASVGVEGGTELFSFTQVRGSVPVFWSQSATSAGVDITRNFELTRRAFRRHISFLDDRYNLSNSERRIEQKLVFVNLLSTSKQGESLLSTAMTNQIRSLTQEKNIGSIIPVEIDFDFHRYVNSAIPVEESLQPLMDTLRPFIFHYGYFDSRNGQPQSGIFRVNCLDCLDRTNVVQMSIAWEALMLAKYESFPKTLSVFKERFTDVWIRNGDAISKGYSGTGSVLSRLVKTAGKTGSRGQFASMLEHSWRSANRFFVSNWEDGDRHNAICNLLRGRSDGQPISAEELAPLTPLPQLTMCVVTWNLQGRRLDESPDVLSSILPEPTADIIVLNFQEVIDLNGMTVLFASRGDESTNKLIDSVVQQHLNQISPESEYIQVASESMVGLYVTIFIRRGYLGSVDLVRSGRFKAGFGGATGNKGSVTASFRLFQLIDLEFVNVHLDSGENRAEERMAQLGMVMDNGSAGGKSLFSHKHHTHRNKNVTRSVFISGDFNFRCDGIDAAAAVAYLMNGKVERVRRLDPYLSTNQNNFLKKAGFREMPLLFPPTYKYVSGTLLSDRRTPSWCDRVFFRCDGPFELSPISYGSVMSTSLSDHKPVIAHFAFELGSHQSSATPPGSSSDLSYSTPVESTLVVEGERPHRMVQQLFSPVAAPLFDVARQEPVDLLSSEWVSSVVPAEPSGPSSNTADSIPDLLS